ncbi:hypothetical protein EUTSA_v10000742mg [Eutrema salsugineum]|uniref:NB-ARC domain-containing protein n=1 Tax=Eutrema salsugineum TaxID=72664 RepID=V4LBB9_EUTSA|nr:probable disease resistance protein At5g45510 isoform X2 [Eutrema salsugineum]ESQ39677.1 hypothetical protein EUTSA_v10000742mg [Eutrema salsugineum]
MAEPEIKKVSFEPTGPKKKVEELCESIVKTLESDGNQKVILVGEAGIGKTWMAKKVDEHVSKKDGLCYQTIWLHLNKKFKVNDSYVANKLYEDEWTLYENIASQLCVHSDFEETEVGDRDEEEEEQKKVEVLLEDMKKNIKEELRKKLKAKLEKLAEEDEKKAKKLAGEKSEAVKKPKNPLGNTNQPAGEKEKLAKPEEKPAEEEKKNTPSARKPYLLLILDDEGMTSEEEVMVHLGLEYFLQNHTPRKILITRREANKKPAQAGGEAEERNESDSNVEGEDVDSGGRSEPGDAATNNEEITEATGEEVKGKDTNLDVNTVTTTTGELWGDTFCHGKLEIHPTTFSEELLEPFSDKDPEDLFHSFFNDFPDFLLEKSHVRDVTLISHLAEKSKNLPAGIVVLVKSLEYTFQNTSDQSSRKEKETLVKEMIERVLTAEREENDIKPHKENPVLLLAYELLTISELNLPIVDCFWHSLDFFEHCGSVYYRDLITQWILEGYFDPVRSVEKAYQDGHVILMELVDRGLLKIQENNVVVPEMAMRNVIDPRRRGHLGTSRLGFSRVYGGNKKKGIGKITQIDDMIKTVQAKKADKIFTLLVSGDRLRRVTLTKFFKEMVDLEVLGLFVPTLDPFFEGFSERCCKLLRVLIIRDCDLLKDIEQLKHLHGLHALEVSGASSLKKISDDFFKTLSKLQSLHLSGLQITSSPSSISQLEDLHCLIIRDCPLLEDLPDIQELKLLEVVDISGARGLQTCFDNTKGVKKNKSKNKNFYHLKRLQLLDFSESQIERLPIFQDSAVADELHSVTRLLLRDCSKLRRLPSLKPLSGLQILDLSGTTSLVEMLEVCFEDKKELKTLNLSGTNLSELATTIEELSSLNELLLRNCTNLEVLPNISKLMNLEVIDVSGCTKLHTIVGSFEDMSYLREVNLSGTKVKTPELPKETKFRCPKLITLADGTSFKGEEWSQIKKNTESEKSEKASSSNANFESREIKEIEPNEPRASDSSSNGDVIKEPLLQVLINRPLFKTTLSIFDSASQQEVMKINETNEPGEEALANAEFVSFVDCSSSRITSILNKINSVKSCWVRMCMDTKMLFSGVDEERLGSLETLSITNLPLLETISCGGSLKSLKELSIECCPNIITLFPDATQLPSSLKDLHAKYCEKLENVIGGVDSSALTNLQERVDEKTCPKFKVVSV